MVRSARRSRWLLALPLLLAVPVFLVACGGEEEAVRPTGEGAPDAAPGEDAGRSLTANLLAGLSQRVARGEGISDGSWTADVQVVGMAMWGDDRSAADRSAHRDHTHLAHIAGHMATELAGDDGEVRAGWMERDPMSVVIYDAFIDASSRGEEAYRAWVVGEGRALLEQRYDAMAGERPR